MNKPAPKTKVCTKCGVRKKLSFFSKHTRNSIGVRQRCKTCTREIDKQYYNKTHVHIQRIYKSQYVNGKRIRVYTNEEKQKRFKRLNEWKKNNPLCDSEIAGKYLGLKLSECPPELIEAKRIQIQIKRYLKNGN